MIDSGKLLGALLQGALSGSGLTQRRSRRRGPFSSSSRNAIQMGILGLGIAAFEHFMSSKAASTTGSGGKAQPPPLPSSGQFAVPPPPPPTAAQNSGAGNEQAEALLLIRAMVAAAAADGTIDDAERQVILERLAESDLSADERNFLAQEMSSPQTVDAIARAVPNQDLAEQVYAASLLAITVDTDAETRYMKSLISKLGLSAECVAKWHRLLGVPPLSSV